MTEKTTYRPAPGTSVNTLRPGARVKVTQCAGGYPLPNGLQEGTEVTLGKYDHGYYPATTDDGKQFEIYCVCVDL